MDCDGTLPLSSEQVVFIWRYLAVGIADRLKDREKSDNHIRSQVSGRKLLCGSLGSGVTIGKSHPDNHMNVPRVTLPRVE
jgi:hypothetical protein